MPYASIAALVVIILFSIYLGWVFLFSALELLINGVLIYAMFLRAYTEIEKEKKFDFYLGGAAAAFIVYVLAGNFLEGLLVWGVTTYLILSFAFAQAWLLASHLQKKHKKAHIKK